MSFSPSVVTQLMVDGQPVLVIERSVLSLKDICLKAKECNICESVLDDIKHKEICVARWEISRPTIYAIHPCVEQAYLSRNMRHPHYQVFRSVVKGRNLDLLRLKTSQVQGAQLIEIRASDPFYCDDCLRVVNNPDLSRINKDIIMEKLTACGKDAERNNICLDLGFSGQRNSRRVSEYFGIARPNLMSHTLENWSKDLFVALTITRRDLFPAVTNEIYNDKDRNSMFANQIETDNDNEAIRLAETYSVEMFDAEEMGACDEEKHSKYAIINFHSDNANCMTAGYSWVGSYSWWCLRRGELVRQAAISYGKSVVNEYMVDLAKHKDAITLHCRVFDCLPRKMQSQGSDIFSKKGKRIAYKFAFLDKGIFYSLFASAMQQVFICYPLLSYDLLMVSAFLANVVMSEIPDHFWMICKSLLKDAKAVGGLNITSCDPIDFGNAFKDEIFLRKVTGVTYPTTQRHPPAVNSPPSKDQMCASIRSIATLIRELRLVKMKIDNIATALHFYGKANEYLVEKAFGAGHLTSMHIIGVAACIGAMPPLFLCVAEIGISTRPWKFLQWAFGYDNEAAYDGVLLRAIATVCGISIMAAEELCCFVTKCFTSGNPGYELLPCQIEFAKVHIILPKGRFGDVVYPDMKLFRIHQQRVYHLDLHGKFLPATELLSDSLFSRVTYVSLDGFWSRAYNNRRSYHYKRNRNGRKLLELKDYFLQDDDQEEYSPKTICERRSARLESDHIVYNLFGPAYESVIMASSLRQPMNLMQIVWEALGGHKSYKSARLLAIDCIMMSTVRPPCVHPDYTTIDQLVPFYRCCLRPSADNLGIPVTNDLYWPSPLFDMSPTTQNKECQLCPFEWRRSVVFGDSTSQKHLLHDTASHLKRNKRLASQRRIINHRRRTEPNYAWNSHRLIPKVESPHGSVMYFVCKEEAVNFTLMEFFFGNLRLFDMTNDYVRSLLFLDKLNSDGQRHQVSKCLRVNGSEKISIFYDVRGFRPSIEKIPFLTAIQYPRGGLLYYFCGSSGERISNPLLRRPLSKAVKGNEEAMYEFLCIVSHRTNDERSVIYKNNSINLLIRWVDATTTEEPMLVILEGSPLEVVDYGEKNNLLGERGWAKVRNLSLIHRQKDQKPYLPVALSMIDVIEKKKKKKRKRKPNKKRQTKRKVARE